MVLLLFDVFYLHPEKLVRSGYLWAHLVTSLILHCITLQTRGGGPVQILRCVAMTTSVTGMFALWTSCGWKMRWWHAILCSTDYQSRAEPPLRNCLHLKMEIGYHAHKMEDLFLCNLLSIYRPLSLWCHYMELSLISYFQKLILRLKMVLWVLVISGLMPSAGCILHRS